MLHGDCLTVTGKTIAENLQHVPDLNFETQKIIFPVEKPVKSTGHLQILYGNLAKAEVLQRSAGKKVNNLKGLQGFLMANMI